MTDALVSVLNPATGERVSFEVIHLDYLALHKRIRNRFEVSHEDESCNLYFQDLCIKDQDDLLHVFQTCKSNNTRLLELIFMKNVDSIPSSMQSSGDTFTVHDPSQDWDFISSTETSQNVSKAGSFVVLPAQHFGVFCAVCDEEIVGVRFKCLNCDSDYNLCQVCETHYEDHHPSPHVFIKIRHPADWNAIRHKYERHENPEPTLEIHHCSEEDIPAESFAEQSGNVTCSKMWDEQPSAPHKLDSNTWQNSPQIISIDWSLMNNKEGRIRANDVLQQEWILTCPYGVQWSEKDIRIIPMQHVDPISANTKLIHHFDFWAKIKRRPDNKKMICQTFCSFQYENNISADHLLAEDLQVRVNWHICSRSWPPQPLAIPMSTVFSLQRTSTGSWFIHYQSVDCSSKLTQKGESIPTQCLVPVEVPSFPAPKVQNLLDELPEISALNKSLKSCHLEVASSKAPNINNMGPPTNASSSSCDDSMLGHFLETLLIPKSDEIPTVFEDKFMTESMVVKSTNDVSDEEWWNHVSDRQRGGLRNPSQSCDESAWLPNQAPSHQYQYTSSYGMQQLFSMGFFNRELNRKLLLKHKDNVEAVVQELLRDSED